MADIRQRMRPVTSTVCRQNRQVDGKRYTVDREQRLTALQGRRPLVQGGIKVDELPEVTLLIGRTHHRVAANASESLLELRHVGKGRVGAVLR